MRLFKAFLIFVITLAFSSPFSAFASNHNGGDIEVKVLDQDGNDIAGNWFVYQGMDADGPLVWNGTRGEVFRMDWGVYYLQGQTKVGYESYQVTGENPQQIVPRGTMTFTLTYYENGYAAAQASAESAPEAVESPVTDSPAMEEAITVEEEEAVETVSEEDVTESDGYPADLPARTPLVVATPSRFIEERVAYTGEASVNAQPMTLAVTGPAGMLSLFLVASGLSSLWITRRKRA